MRAEVYDIPITTFHLLYKGRRHFKVGEYLLVTTALYFGRISPIFAVVSSSCSVDDILKDMHHQEDMSLFDCAHGWCSYVDGYELWHIVNDPNDVVFKVVGLVADHECMRATFGSLNDSRVFARRSVGYPFDRVCIYSFNRYAFSDCSMVCEFYIDANHVRDRYYGMSGCGCQCPE